MNPAQDSTSSAPAIDPATESSKPKPPSLDQLLLEIISKAMNENEAETITKSLELKKGQAATAKVQNIMEQINLMKVEKGGSVTVTDDFLRLLEEAKNSIPEGGPELHIVEPAKGKTYTKEEKEKLIENVRICIENLNTDNETLLQEVTQLRNTLLEILKMANDISNKKDSLIKRMINAAAGR